MAAVTPGWGAVIGTVIGVGLAVALSAAGIPHRPATATRVATPEATGSNATKAFLAAWARSRAITYAADTRFVRTIDGRTALSAEGFEARRPPQWVERQGDSWTGLIGGHRLECNDAIDGKFRCTSGVDTVDYSADVASELRAFSSWLTEPASYDIVQQGDCFVMQRTREVLAPPLGDRAQYCFDPDGVPIDAEITTATAVDHKTLTNVRTSVTDNDLAVHDANNGG